MAFRNVSQVNDNGSSVSSLTVNKPTETTDGDIVVLSAIVDSSSITFTWPAGFTEITQNPSLTGARFRCAWKAASGEGATYQVTFSASTLYAQVLAASWFGRNSSQWSATPVVTVVDTYQASPHTVNATGITAANADDIALFVGVKSNNNANPFVMTPPTNYTVRMDTTGPSYAIAQLATRDNVSAGATGTLTFTETSASDQSRVGVLVLAIAAAGGSVIPVIQNHRLRH